jgi:hypothetical protein
MRTSPPVLEGGEVEHTEELELEYTKPEIVDYGDLREITAQGGGLFSDVPIGAPLGSNPGRSQP